MLDCKNGRFHVCWILLKDRKNEKWQEGEKMKWIIVTGDSGGLGSAIVENILKDLEYGVIGISRKLGEDTQVLLNKYQERYKHIDFDLSLPDKIKDLYKYY